MQSSRGILLGGFIILALLLNGCAFKYNMTDVKVDFQGEASKVKNVAVGTSDQRKVVLSGECPPTYIGMQRGGFGIPSRVNTDSGLAFADDVTNAVSESLSKKGFKAFPVYIKAADGAARISELFKESKADRYLLFAIKKWESDTYINIGLEYEIELTVYDAAMAKLASIAVSEQKDIPRSGWGTTYQVSRTEVPLAFQKALEKLLNYPKILNALQ